MSEVPLYGIDYSRPQGPGARVSCKCNPSPPQPALVNIEGLTSLNSIRYPMSMHDLHGLTEWLQPDASSPDRAP